MSSLDVSLPGAESLCLAQPSNERVHAVLTELARVLACQKLSLSSEKAMQADLEAALKDFPFKVEREVSLTDNDVVDFLLSDSIAVECKLYGANKKAVWRQLARYALSPRVSHIVLVSNVGMTLPAAIEGKPACHLKVSQAWL